METWVGKRQLTLLRNKIQLLQKRNLLIPQVDSKDSELSEYGNESTSRFLNFSPYADMQRDDSKKHVIDEDDFTLKQRAVNDVKISKHIAKSWWNC